MKNKEQAASRHIKRTAGDWVFDIAVIVFFCVFTFICIFCSSTPFRITIW